MDKKEFYTEEELEKLQKEMLEIPSYYDGYPFTHQQAFEIKDILILNFKREQVMHFIVELRSCCEGAACLLDQPDYKSYKNDRKSMVALLEKSHALLDELRTGRAIRQLASFSALDEYSNNPEYSECQELAVTTEGLLGILIRKIKRLDDSMVQRFKGRPNADSKGIVAEMAKVWEKCFNKKPTTYVDSLFMRVVKIVLEGLNLPHGYPERKLRAALKKG